MSCVVENPLFNIYSAEHENRLLTKLHYVKVDGNPTAVLTFMKYWIGR